jgi:hypothetical protein
MRKHFSTTSNCNLELPEPGATMKFNNYKEMLTRPFIVYSDFVASLVKTQRTDGKIHRHEPKRTLRQMYSRGANKPRDDLDKRRSERLQSRRDVVISATGTSQL